MSRRLWAVSIACVALIGLIAMCGVGGWLLLPDRGDEIAPPPEGDGAICGGVGIAARYAHPPQRLLPRAQGISIRCTATQEMSVARLCHPSRAGEMAFPGPFCPVRLPLRIDVKHDAGDFAPIRPFGFRIEQPQIGHEMLFIIPCQNGIAWSIVRNRWIERRRRFHVAVSPPCR